MDPLPIDRNKAKEDAKIVSKKADLKQHADKLVRGFENIDNASANRAIWELVQNACDLSSKCIVTIDYRNGSFSFTHNGKPFTTVTLISLIKQVSSKEDEIEVGKFGTGFITTHSFGRKFKINSLLEVEGQFIQIKDFLIDRSPKESEGIADNIITQEDQVYDLIQKGSIVQEQKCLTTFTYLPESKTEFGYINESLKNLHEYIPLVLTLNERLFSVTVIEESGITKTYQKQNKCSVNDYYLTTIQIDDSVKKIFSLRNQLRTIEVILPLEESNQAILFPSRIAKLFLYFPLIGTELWGSNFIFHSTEFAPTEPRDGLHLKSKNEQVREYEEANRTLIQKASKMVFEFIKANASQIASPINLAPINFITNSDKPLLNEYFQELKSQWINEFKHYPLVETDSGNIQPSQALFLHKELLLDEKSFTSIFALANRFWKNIPKIHLVNDWTKIIDEWSLSEIKYIRIEDLVNKIQQSSSLMTLNAAENLKHFYSYLIDHEHSGVFNEHKLLPNIKGEFRKLTNLRSTLNITQDLTDIADVIMPEIPKRHVHPDFKFNLEFTKYSRKDYSREINDNIANRIGEKTTSREIPEVLLQNLIKYCKIATTVDSSSVPSKMAKLISRYYKQSEDLLALPTIPDDELNISPAQKRLLRLFLNDLSKKECSWVIEGANLEFLREVIEVGSSYEAYKDLFQTLAIFPNQLNELREQGKLALDQSIPSEIKDLYDKVVKPDLLIRASLVHEKFANYLKDKEKKTTRNLTEKIESVFFDEQTQLSIDEHPFRTEILDIIEETKVNDAYQKYFPLIYSKRSNILVELADGEDTFSILSLNPSRIKKLANIGVNPDLDELIELGEQALIQKKQENSDFLHKKTIGNHIEEILKTKLHSLITNQALGTIVNVQDGQDMIIFLANKPAYFIEVKSIWNKNTPVRISKNQTLKSYEEKERYALCTVDMTSYDGDDRYEVDSIDKIEQFIKINLDIGKQVTHLIEILSGTNNPNTFSLDGDYRTLIPKSYIDKGISLLEFSNHLVEYISRNYGQ